MTKKQMNPVHTRTIGTKIRNKIICTPSDKSRIHWLNLIISMPSLPQSKMSTILGRGLLLLYLHGSFVELSALLIFGNSEFLIIIS